MFDTIYSKKSAILIFPILDRQEQSKLTHREDELRSLVDTMGLTTLATISYKVREINPAYYLGKGQVEDLKEQILFYSPDCIIFDTSLSSRILRNLEEELDICIIDREEVIIQIFSDRALTHEAKLQVALARAEYSLPRLRRRWESLSQQRGGVKGSKGLGEKQLELDRRALENTIVVLKREIEKVKKVRSVQRANRKKSNTYSFALVGYTNVGKSSLLNLLTDANSLVENKLFATLDPTTRKLKLKNKINTTLTDTVGFVSNLPHHLINAFSATLEEATYADCLIIVLDLSNSEVEEQYKTTLDVLASLNLENSERIVVFNKVDNICSDISYKRLKLTTPDSIDISVKEKINIEALLDRMYEKATQGKKKVIKHLSLYDTSTLNSIFKDYIVLDVEFTDTEAIITYLE